AIVVKFSWNLDFLTQAEIEGKVGKAKEKRRSERKSGDNSAAPEINSEDMENVLNRLDRSNSLSFRDNFSTMSLSSSGERTSIYLPVSVNAIMLKILIPSLSATKLLKFDTTTLVKEITMVMIKKHRFTESASAFAMYHKAEDGQETLLDPNK